MKNLWADPETYEIRVMLFCADLQAIQWENVGMCPDLITDHRIDVAYAVEALRRGNENALIHYLERMAERTSDVSGIIQKLINAIFHGDIE